jgi:hypothetical protein
MTNNKQQTAVKLYTEEQVKEMFEQFQTHLPFHYEILLQEHMNKLTPIELPSDEEIDEKAFQVPYDNTKDFYDLQFIKGAKWMRDKIKGDEQ